MIKSGGTLRMHGELGRDVRARLARVAAAGSDFLLLRPPGVRGKWQVGDQIVVATTAFHRQPATGQVVEPPQNEERVISALSEDGLVVHLDQPLAYEHYGGQPARFTGSNLTLDESAYVANLRRTIRIAPLDATRRDGHIMIMHGGKAFVDAVEVSRLGVAGQMGRYPFHWHRAGDISGQYITRASIHHTAQRCIVVHGSNNALVANNLCFDFVGHGIFLEDHDERKT